MPLRILAVALLLAAFPTEASANVIWPAAILTGRLLDWWIITRRSSSSSFSCSALSG